MKNDIDQTLHAIKQLGLTVDQVVRSKHYKVYVSAPDNRKAIFVCSVSASCRRSLKNLEAAIRRFARGGK